MPCAWLRQATDKHGNTALHLAAKFCTAESATTLVLLCQAGADLCAVNRHGETPLHLAAQYEHHELVRRLLDFARPVLARRQQTLSAFRSRRESELFGE